MIPTKQVSFSLLDRDLYMYGEIVYMSLLISTGINVPLEPYGP